ncbi:MAG: hypothetical protein FJ145_22105 [Deltaproteobacteria bacterium]|nr:hypothetical protein [Deltaproteobacteria bacterium]
MQKFFDAFAELANVKVPDADFTKIAAELNQIEKKYIAARESAEIIKNPRILCAASEQFAEPSLGFDLDVAVLEKTFPKCVEVERSLTAKRLRELLTKQRFDIVHLVLGVDADDADLIFSPIDFGTNKPATAAVDKMSAEGFGVLLKESNTKLVVLATCKALLLGVEVSHIANMAAADATITGEQAAEWEECFYGFLAEGKSLFKAFELTRSQSSTPIRPIRNKDVVFAVD